MTRYSVKSMQRLSVVGQRPAIAPLLAPPLRATELGAFCFGSKLEWRIVQKIGQAIADYELVSDGDRIMVRVSGGKDSYVLLDALLLLRRKSPVQYEIVAVNLDRGWAGLSDRRTLLVSNLRAAASTAPSGETQALVAAGGAWG
jgi:hypothetical protein